MERPKSVLSHANSSVFGSSRHEMIGYYTYFFLICNCTQTFCCTLVEDYKEIRILQFEVHMKHAQSY